MRLKGGFLKPVYDDAPWLSDQLLLPQLARGFDVHILSAFAPSYIFKLIEDLASSKDVEPGFLNLVFFVPGEMAVRSQSIARFHKYLLTYSSDWEVSNFVSNSLALLEESRQNEFGGLQIQVLHTSQKRPLTKSLAGVIVDQDSRDDYVSFVDAKGGDNNSPVEVNRSWELEESFAAQEVLGKVAAALNNEQPRASLLGPKELEEWLIYLSNFYETNPPVRPSHLGEELNDSEEEFEEDDDLDSDEDSDEDELLEHLLNLDDFNNEDKYGWYGGEDDEFDLGPVTVRTDRDSAIYGHIPPLEPFLAAVLSTSDGVARCLCGQKFIRAYGCDEVVWDRWITDHREE